MTVEERTAYIYTDTLQHHINHLITATNNYVVAANILTTTSRELDASYPAAREQISQAAKQVGVFQDRLLTAESSLATLILKFIEDGYTLTVQPITESTHDQE